MTFPPSKKKIHLDKKLLEITLKIIIRMLKCTFDGLCQGADGAGLSFL